MDLDDHEVAEFFDHSIGRVAEHVRARMELVGATDPASKDLLAGIAERLDQQVATLRGKVLSLGRPGLATIRRWSPRRRGSSAA